jgi:hypothetical protein
MNSNNAHIITEHKEESKFHISPLERVIKNGIKIVKIKIFFVNFYGS